jgi:glycosyltransferase involved in cell wall biosynthesis
MSLITGALILGNAKTHPLEECIKSYLPFIDELVIYNDSKDGSLERIMAQLPSGFKCRIIQQQGEIDFARFRNECIEASDTEWVFFFFSDEILVPKAGFTPERFRKFLQDYRGHALAFPRYNEPDGADYPDLQTNLVRKGRALYIRKIHEVCSPPARDVLTAFMIRHVQKSILERLKKDEIWKKIDAETMRLHMERPEVKDFYEAIK